MRNLNRNTQLRFDCSGRTLVGTFTSHLVGTTQSAKRCQTSRDDERYQQVNDRPSQAVSTIAVWGFKSTGCRPRPAFLCGGTSVSLSYVSHAAELAAPCPLALGLLAASGRHRPARRAAPEATVACRPREHGERTGWSHLPGCLILYASRPASRALRVGRPMAYGHP
jgi:hypothetical protein